MRVRPPVLEAEAQLGYVHIGESGVWSNLWDDGRDLAAHAHEFMAKRLTR